MPFLTIQTLTDEIFAAGKRTYIKAGFARELSESLIETLWHCGAQVGSGSLADRGAGDGRRDPPRRTRGDGVPAPGGELADQPAGHVGGPADDDAEIDWVRRSFAALEPHLTGGKYVNFMGEDESRMPPAVRDNAASARARQTGVRPRQRLPAQSERRAVT